MQFTVDEVNGKISGVKVLGPVSKNKRRYTPAARRDVVRLCEGAAVRLKHDNTSYGDNVAWLENLQEEGDSVYGDMNLKPKHPLREQILWDATNRPQEFGLSIDGEGVTSPASRDGWRDVRAVKSVSYVALVTDPATTISIRESEESVMDLDTLKAEHGDLLAKLREEIENEFRNGEELKKDRAKLISERDEAAAKLQESQKVIDEFRQKELRAQRQLAIAKEAEDLKAGEVSEQLMEEFVGMKPETVTLMLKDRAESRQLQESGTADKPKPKSSDGVGDPAADAAPWHKQNWRKKEKVK